MDIGGSLQSLIEINPEHALVRLVPSNGPQAALDHARAGATDE